jgi:hypothetical protein
MLSLKSVAACLVLCAPLAASAADDIELLKVELEKLKADYSARVTALEARISELESASAVVADVAAAPPVIGSTPIKDRRSAFNPAMSVILAGNYARLSQDPETFRFAGFIPNDGEVGPGERSFNLGESELTLSANIDPFFYGNLTVAMASDDSIAVEEAYIRTLALHHGMTLKGGRFFSGVGYLNELHAHAWDFIDQPLAYQVFFAGHLAQDGLQLKWVAPSDTFIELGAETGSGRAFPGTARNRNGLGGNALFAHFGGDLGDSTSWRAGVSWLDHRAESRAFADTETAGVPVLNAFTGTARTWMVDATLKWAPGGNSVNRQLKVQGEYLHRKEEGELAFDLEGLDLSDGYRSAQSGWYLQSVYQFRPRWRFGARYDALDAGSPRIGLVRSGLLASTDLPVLLSASPDRFTLMLDWSPSEFSRFRLQHAWDDSRAADSDEQLFLQYIFSIGAHGAHKF